MASVAVLGAAACCTCWRGSRAPGCERCDSGVSVSTWGEKLVQTAFNTMDFTDPVSFGPQKESLWDFCRSIRNLCKTSFIYRGELDLSYLLVIQILLPVTAVSNCSGTGGDILVLQFVTCNEIKHVLCMK